MTSKQITTGIAIAVALVVIAVFFMFNPFASQTTSTNASLSSTSATELVVQDELVGTGTAAAAGDLLTVNYTGKLENGTVFDTSIGKAPFKFTLGAGQVIPGWDQGLVGMREGGRRLLIIPASLAYGATGNGPVPPNATLTFEVELVKVTPPSSAAPLPEGEFAQ